MDRVLHLEDLVGSPDCAFIATGVTTSALLPGPEATHGVAGSVDSRHAEAQGSVDGRAGSEACAGAPHAGDE